jgi:PAS domain-containing protein
MATRFTDDLFNNTDGSDFIVRKRLPLVVQICIIFAIAFLAIYLTACIMSDTGSKVLFFCTLTITIGSLTWFTVFFSSHLRDLVLATEFQNAMLASAAQLSTCFCMITKRDGSIVYIDPGFQKLFPQFLQSNDRNIDGLLRSAGIHKELIVKVINLVEQNTEDRVLLPFVKGDGNPLPIMLTIDILPRPKGYLLLRGRDYVEKRTGAEEGKQPSVNVALMQALQRLPEGVLVTDGSGIITYVNKTLEEWLGYETGELYSRPFKVGHIFYQYGGKDAGVPVNSDFTGEIILQRKDRSLITTRMQQTSLGKSAGLSAFVYPAAPSPNM